MLAAIVEKVTQKPFPAWIDDNIFKPLQMNSSQVLTDYSTVIKNVAESYYPDSGGFRKSYDMLAVWGSSSIFSTVEDLAKWVIAFKKGLDDKDPVYTRMISTDTLNNGEKNTYTYGNGVTDDHGLLNFKHTGGWANFASIISTYPRENISIILLSNNGSFDYGSANKVARALLGSKFKQDSAAKPSALKPMDYGSKPTAKVDTSVLQKYTNTYKLGDDWYATFTLEDGKLMVQATGEAKFPTEPKSDTVIWVPAYNSAFIFRDITDKANTVKYHDVIAKRITITPIKVDVAQYTGNYYSTELEATYRLYVDKGKLMMHHMRLGDFELGPDPVIEGRFGSSVGKMMFEKDTQGKVTGFKLSGGRIANIRFDKL